MQNEAQTRLYNRFIGERNAIIMVVYDVYCQKRNDYTSIFDIAKTAVVTVGIL